MIPKVIHYCWFGGNPKPKELQKYIETWKEKAPDYEIIEWNESNFDVTSHPFMKAAYDNKAWAFVSDYARLKIVEEHGGIYLDTDVELLKSPDPLLENKAYFPVQQNHLQIATGLGFGAEPHNPVVLAMMNLYDNVTFDPNQKEKLACPILNTRALNSLGWHHPQEIFQTEDMTVYPPRFFDPISTGKSKNLCGPDTYSIHHYAATWTTGKQRWKRKLVNFVGAERIHKIKQLLGRA